MYDYAAGEIDWLAHRLPTEREAGGEPTAGQLAHDDVVTCRLDDGVHEVLERSPQTGAAKLAKRLAGSDLGTAIVTTPAGILVGVVCRAELEAAVAKRPGRPLSA